MSQQTGEFPPSTSPALYPGHQLSDYRTRVRYDMPIDALLERITTGEFVDLPLQRAEPGYASPGTEARYWYFFVPPKHELTDLDPSSGSLTSIIPVDIRPYMEFNARGDVNCWQLCRKAVHEDMLQRRQTDVTVRELLSTVSGAMNRRVSMAMDPLVAGVAYRFCREADGSYTKIDSRVMFSRHLLSTSRLLQQRINHMRTAGDPIPAWMVKAAAPFRREETAKKMAISIMTLVLDQDPESGKYSGGS